MKLLLFFVAFTFSLTSFAETVKIYIAGSMKNSFKLILEEYKKHNKNVEIQAIYGSSGKGFFQLINGAKYDIFISADEKYPEEVYKNKLARRSGEIYAEGSLALLFKNEYNKSIDYLLKAKTIAIANPKLAPYGIAAMEFMKNTGIYENIKDKIVTGQDLIQVVQYIKTENADVAFVAYPLVANEPEFKNKLLKLDKNHYSPIKQAMILTTYGEENLEAKKIYDFIKSGKVKKILTSYGFDVNGD
ncbi:molybdate ABC transporter substrate-binding protein [Calditerrivibrio nitroreducens]|uniref:Molybdenum ABC transporter, periplasmic molybdate-binding protein n=1 Tax=Calditerrivibrio nitroreducens (strain DSM 19672 / NBRC 101217 / Yu37-1) TaxID=768670 RepID=E4TG51_CALNY|nr:molybdate ABC transporter substrate-binding protein [Calditerrivibrio nitroreducens]ADR18601.1 molybdenum ABC transporter, periplasmic molybdate-binding protein [Calditerrivibrio nitroreducens DSM 19672]